MSAEIIIHPAFARRLEKSEKTTPRVQATLAATIAMEGIMQSTVICPGLKDRLDPTLRAFEWECESLGMWRGVEQQIETMIEIRKNPDWDWQLGFARMIRAELDQTK